jgi:RNA polymerase sigma-70 factor (ECF subfamily)
MVRFDSMLNANLQRIYAFFRSRVRSKDDVEDMTSQTFVIAYKSLYQCRGEGAQQAAWLTRIAQSVLVREWQKRNALGTTVPFSDSLLYNARTESDRAMRLAEAVQYLPDDLKAVVELFYYVGFSYAEIAEKLAIPDGAVKTRLQSARNILRKEMNNEV